MRRRLGTLAVLAALVALWQALYAVVGESGLSSPAQAAARLVVLMGTASFWDNAAETGRAFAASLAISAGVAGAAYGLQPRRVPGPGCWSAPLRRRCCG